MWNPTTNPNTESDNKKKEQLEACGFSATAVDTAAYQPTAFKHINPNNRSSFNSGTEFNIFDDNNKKDQYCDESVDSGILSGGISSSIFDSGDIQDSTSATTSRPFQQLPQTQPQHFQQQSYNKEQEYTTLDSGCITSEQLTDEHDDNADGDVCIDEEAHQVLNQQQKHIQYESANATGANKATVDADIMRFGQKVDGNISEWFCNLSLQSDQTQSAQLPGINNLNAAQRGTNQQQQRNANNKQHTTDIVTGSTITNTTAPKLNPSNAWENFYQQNDEGDTHLHIACALGEEDIVSALIRMVPHPCLFNIQNDDGQTPLHIATLAKQLKIMRMLLIAGAEPTIRDCRGNTALHLACDGGDLQSVNALTAKITQCEVESAHRQYGHRSTDNTMSFVKCAQLPSDLEIRNYDGERCVHIAAQRGHIDILRVLESCDADMNAREGRSGYTPLHIAIICNNDEIIQFLLNDCKKLNLEAMTYAGRTAYQIADALHKYKMADILKERGAEPITPPDSDYDSSDFESEDEKEQDWLGDHGLYTNCMLMVA